MHDDVDESDHQSCRSYGLYLHRLGPSLVTFGRRPVPSLHRGIQQGCQCSQEFELLLCGDRGLKLISQTNSIAKYRDLFIGIRELVST